MMGVSVEGGQTVRARRARRKIDQVDKADIFDNLKKPPGNGLELLKGRRQEKWAVEGLRRVPGKFFGTTAKMWMDMQAGYNLEREEENQIVVRHTTEELMASPRIRSPR